jgi:hypothetical protein
MKIMDSRQTFDAREFLGNLKRDELTPPIVLPGMVKPADDSDDYLMFAQGTVCENWVRIPLASIESIDLVNLVPCAEHTHPLVLLRLKAPETDEGRVFASLMQAATQSRRQPSRRTTEPPPMQAPPARAYAPGPADRTGRPTRIVRGPRAGGTARAFDDPGITAEPRWRWCGTVPDIDIDDHGTWCLDWCWESAHQASYMLCDDLRTLTTE